MYIPYAIKQFGKMGSCLLAKESAIAYPRPGASFTYEKRLLRLSTVF